LLAPARRSNLAERQGPRIEINELKADR